MSADTTWLIANWKMNGNAAAVRSWAFTVNAELARRDADVSVVFCPPSLYLDDAHAALPVNAALQLGAQNCHPRVAGAFTGEISAAMLADKGCTFVIVGHSECRGEGESDEIVAQKAVAACAANITPIICVGESLADYEAKQTTQALDRQLAHLCDLPRGSYLVAYEPIWAIGSGRTPNLPEIQAAHSHIKSVLGSSTPVLYGGSVAIGNISEILALPEVSGALIGGASLTIESMAALITSAAEITLRT